VGARFNGNDRYITPMAFDMSDPAASAHIQIPTRAPSATPTDDIVMPFEVASLDLRGRVVRLGPVVDQILARHGYPTPVAKLLGEAVVLTVMLGSALKIDGRFILQTQSDGPVRMLVVDFTAPGKVRACARFDGDRVAAATTSGQADSGALLGKGHLAMTIDQGPDMSRYQGLVALEGGSLEDAAHEYFHRSEQIPTRVRLAVAEELRAGEGGASHRWRAGGILLQFLPKSPERARVADLDPGDAPEGIEPHVLPEDDAWVEGRALVSTVEDVELIDPALSSERLVYRLFHEPGVRVFRGSAVHAECSCSRHNVEAMLLSFSQDDRDHMVEDGKISVTCEFCSANYQFTPDEIGAKA
jgi:molecular chaperone Hsp33